jgi:anti-sigma factor RsiW
MSREHMHSKATCIKILRRLSAYLDDELSGNICQEVRRHLEVCPKCELFLHSLKQTVSLCRGLDTKPLSPPLKARLRQEILRAIRASA